MNNHDDIRQKLPLAAAGALEAEELREIQRHVHQCEACGRTLEMWAALSGGLRRMPQPAVPPGLVQRTQARILQSQTVAQSARANESLLVALGLFGWVVSLAFWVLVGQFTAGLGILPDGSLRDAFVWSLASSLFVWITAGSAAVLMRGRLVRRTL
jgi:anti-sigma factor RsiW